MGHLVMTAKRSEITKIVYIRGFGIPEEVPIDFNQDVSPEDELLENSDLSVRAVENVYF